MQRGLLLREPEVVSIDRVVILRFPRARFQKRLYLVRGLLIAGESFRYEIQPVAKAPVPLFCRG